MGPTSSASTKSSKATIWLRWLWLARLARSLSAALPDSPTSSTDARIAAAHSVHPLGTSAVDGGVEDGLRKCSCGMSARDLWCEPVHLWCTEVQPRATRQNEIAVRVIVLAAGSIANKYRVGQVCIVVNLVRIRGAKKSIAEDTRLTGIPPGLRPGHKSF